MKKIITRLLILAFTIFFTVYSSLYALCVPVYASALPDYPTDFSYDTFHLLQGGGGSSGAAGLFVDPAGLSLMTEAIMCDMANRGMAASSETAKKIALDFAADYNSGALENKLLDVAVIQPAQAAKYLLWDTPVEALTPLANSIDSGIVIIANSAEEALETGKDNAVFFGNKLFDMLYDFYYPHIKDGVYYSDVSDFPEFSFSKVNFENHIIYDGNDITIMNSNSYNYWGINSSVYYVLYCGWLKDPNQPMSRTEKLYFSNVDGSYLGHNSGEHYNLHHDKITSCTLPMYQPNYFDSFSGTVNDFYKEAENYIDPSELPEEIIIPKIDEMNVKLDQSLLKLDSLADMAISINDSVQDVLKKLKEGTIEYPLPAEEPYPLPYPIVEPIIYPWPIVYPDPGDDPDPGVDPEPGVDPVDPIDPPGPDDPVDPEDPDGPELEIPDDSGGNPLVDLSEFFPFCLPMDIYLAMQMLKAESPNEYYALAASVDGEVQAGRTVDNPVVFDIPMKFHLSGLNQEDINHTFTIDIIQPAGEGSGSAEPYVVYLRFFLIFIYIMFLILVTVKITPH